MFDSSGVKRSFMPSLARIEPSGKPKKPKFFSKITRYLRRGEKKTVSVGNYLLHEIARGAAKKVYIVMVSKISPCGIKDKNLEKAFYSPVSSFMNLRKTEIKKEVKLMKKIGDDLTSSWDQDGNHINITSTKLLKMKKHLALEAKVVTGKGRIRGKYTVEVKKATGDFEREISRKENPLTLVHRFKFGAQYLYGMKSLHSAGASGYAYGDPKPENCLIYNVDSEKILKISDFGKTKKMQRKWKGNRQKKQDYTGNPRFGPPEGKLTKKGDVYGSGLVLIRTLEEEFFESKVNDDPLLKVDEKDFDHKARQKRRGVERYIVEHKAFTATESRGWKGIVRLLARRLLMKKGLSTKMKEKWGEALNNYINNFTKKMKGTKYEGIADDLSGLLKEMTNHDPDKRPTMEEASKTYEKLLLKATIVDTIVLA